MCNGRYFFSWHKLCYKLWDFCYYFNFLKCFLVAPNIYDQYGSKISLYVDTIFIWIDYFEFLVFQINATDIFIRKVLFHHLDLSLQLIWGIINYFFLQYNLPFFLLFFILFVRFKFKWLGHDFITSTPTTLATILFIALSTIL